MKAVLFCFALFLALASVHAIRLPVAYRPGVRLLDTCYNSHSVTGWTNVHFRWNTTKDPVQRANVAQWQIQTTDMANFASGTTWYQDQMFPSDVYEADFLYSSPLVRCWPAIYARVRAVAANGQTGPWSVVGGAKRGLMVPPRVTNITIAKSNGRTNVGAV